MSAPWRRRLTHGGLALAGGVVLQALAVGAGGLLLRPRPADVAVVLGNRVEPDGRPSPRLRGRLEAALALLRGGQVRWVLVSGGLGVEGHEEAEVMAAWLVAAGAPADRVLQDRQGWTTWDTAQSARACMKEHGWSSAVVVSQYYHLPRCLLALRRAGVAEVSAAAAPFAPELRDPYSLLREVAALWAYALRDGPPDAP